MKACYSCGQEKPVSSFNRRSDQPDGLARRCKDCGVYDADRQRALMGKRKARAASDPEFAERQRRYSREYRQRQRADRYGITDTELAAMEARAAGRCMTCGRTADEVACVGKSGERLHVDHDHATGLVRGMLCKKCNSILGLADDDVDRLMALAAYLLQNQNVLQEASA